MTDPNAILDHDRDLRTALASFSTAELFEEIDGHLDGELVEIEVLSVNYPLEMIRASLRLVEDYYSLSHQLKDEGAKEQLGPLITMLASARDALVILEGKRTATAKAVDELRRRIEAEGRAAAERERAEDEQMGLAPEKAGRFRRG